MMTDTDVCVVIDLVQIVYRCIFFHNCKYTFLAVIVKMFPADGNGIFSAILICIMIY